MILLLCHELIVNLLGYYFNTDIADFRIRELVRKKYLILVWIVNELEKERGDTSLLKYMTSSAVNKSCVSWRPTLLTNILKKLFWFNLAISSRKALRYLCTAINGHCYNISMDLRSEKEDRKWKNLFHRKSIVWKLSLSFWWFGTFSLWSLSACIFLYIQGSRMHYWTPCECVTWRIFSHCIFWN